MNKKFLWGIALFFVLGLANPMNGSWNFTGSMNIARISHSSTLLDNGLVLVAGGRKGQGFTIYNSAELYDPLTGNWTFTKSMNIQRYSHGAILMKNGKVLVTGGARSVTSETQTVTNSTEVQDPATGIWSISGSMSFRRMSWNGRWITLLQNGKILAVGGLEGNGGNDLKTLNTAELYDPTTSTWQATGSLNTARCDHTSTLLPNGNVLVVGGWTGNHVLLSSAELYDSNTGNWSLTAFLHTARSGHTATLLQNGKVLIAGGINNGGLKSAELQDPDKSAWIETELLNVGRFYHSAELLLNGQVLIIGGYNVMDLDSCEVYDPVNSTWQMTGLMNTHRGQAQTNLIWNGRIIAIGGMNGENVCDSAEIFTCDYCLNPYLPISMPISISYQTIIGEMLNSSYVIFNLTLKEMNLLQIQKNISVKASAICLKTSTTSNVSLTQTLNSSLFVKERLTDLLDLNCPLMNTSDLIQYYTLFQVEFFLYDQKFNTKFFEFIYSVNKSTHSTFQASIQETINSSLIIQLNSSLEACLNNSCVFKDGKLIIRKNTKIFFAQTIEDKHFFLEFNYSKISCSKPSLFEKQLSPVSNNTSQQGIAIYCFQFMDTDTCDEGKFEIWSKLDEAGKLRLLNVNSQANYFAFSFLNIIIEADKPVLNIWQIFVIILSFIVVILIVAFICYCRKRNRPQHYEVPQRIQDCNEIAIPSKDAQKAQEEAEKRGM